MGAASGYEAQRFVALSIGHFWSESFGQIYPELKALRAARWIEPVNEAGRGRRARVRYRLTAAGRRALLQWLSQPAAPMPVRQEVLLKVFFGQQQSAPQVAEHLNREGKAAKARQETLTAIGRTLLDDFPNDPDLAFSLMTVRAGQLRSAAWLTWVADCRRLLAAHLRGRNAVRQTWLELDEGAP